MVVLSKTKDGSVYFSGSETGGKFFPPVSEPPRNFLKQEFFSQTGVFFSKQEFFFSNRIDFSQTGVFSVDL